MSEGPVNVAPRRKHRVLRGIAIGLAVVLVVVVTGGFLVYRHLSGNINVNDVTKQLGTDRPSEAPVQPDAPAEPLNVLIIGSDTRKGQGDKIGGETPGLSDTTILLHLSASRKFAYGVSLPRDAMVDRPTCERKDGTTDPGGLSMFNEAYAIGGPGCTQRTVEQLTGVRIQHYVVIDFKGFKNMVDALGGVEVCVPTAVNDTTGHIQLPAGTYNVKGERALDYVRVRHDLGTAENGDIGRMKRQQTFIASMANKAVSAGTLANPIRLYKFLDAGTKSLTTDPGLASLKKLVDLGRSFDGIGLSNIQFLTVPFKTYAPDPNRLQWTSGANRLWKLMREDKPIGSRYADQVTTADTKDGKPASPSASPSPSAGASSSPTSSPTATPSEEAAAERAAENGLCA